MTRSIRTIQVLTCAVCLTWLGLAPPAAATPTDRRQGRPETRLIEPGGGLAPLHLSLRTASLAQALDGVRLDSRAAVRECEVQCLGCAGGLLGLAAATAGIATGCGGAVLSGGLTLGICLVAIVGADVTVLVAATKCNECDACLSPPPGDPETPPGGGSGSDECLPCEPTEPLADCLDPEIDWCEDVQDSPNP